MLINRDLNEELQICRGEYPIVTITGPRQSGKTTLAKIACGDLPYVSLEEPLIHAYFDDDPKGFLHQYRNGAIFDEVQNAPELVSYLQVLTDENPTPGRFVLTGSQHFGMTARISQSLAGRTAILELLPFGIGELKRGNMLPDNLNQFLWKGAYPPIYDRNLRPDRWYSDYLATYLQRDVRQLSQIHQMEIFSRFLRYCATQVGQIINTNRFGAELGVDHKTVRNWLTILQASYVIALLPPFYANLQKRIIKTPKLYFYDTGLVCHLLGILDPDQLQAHPLRGAIFENWVFLEIVKYFFNKGRQPQIYFWRTHSGQEVDFIIEISPGTTAVEVKSGMTVKPEMISTLKNVIALWTNRPIVGSVVYGGSDFYKLHDCSIFPWNQVQDIFKSDQTY